MVINLQKMIKDINKNNDGFITKEEIKEYQKNYNPPSIFANYFRSITSKVAVNTFLFDCQKLMQDSQDKESANAKTEKQTEKKEPYFEYVTGNPPIQNINNLEEIPLGSHNNIRDARNCDISKLKLSKEELLNLTIDKTTILSEEQRAIINEYTEKMKNPGLGIENLHTRGFTGNGVKMAIIDQPLGEHKEYSSNIKEHHDINATEMEWPASMHAAAVTSIAAGKTTGVAPDADVSFYSAVNLSNDPKDIETYKANLLKEIEKNKDNQNYVDMIKQELQKVEEYGTCTSNQPYVDTINQILDNNEKVSDSEKVFVVSISWGFHPLAPGYDELQKALERAKEQGVFIISTRLDEHYGMDFSGANRDPQADPNDPKSYEAGAFWKDDSEGMDKEVIDNFLLIPMDHRTVADYTDGTSYRYEGNDGGCSWAVPWLAGLYVLAKQADPNITPQKFWDIAIETSNECTNNDSGEYVGRIVNPEKLIDVIKARIGI